MVRSLTIVFARLNPPVFLLEAELISIAAIVSARRRAPTCFCARRERSLRSSDDALIGVVDSGTLQLSRNLV